MAPVSLTPLDARWTEPVAALVADPEVRRFTRIPEPPPAGFAGTWIDAYEKGRADGSREGFAAVDGAGEFVGLGLAVHTDREAAEAELGYIVAVHARGQGIGTAILRLLTAWGFAELAALRLVLVIDAENHASRRIAERCGYQLEGVMRSTHVKQGVRADVGLWSRLPSDPAVT